MGEMLCVVHAMSPPLLLALQLLLLLPSRLGWSACRARCVRLRAPRLPPAGRTLCPLLTSSKDSTVMKKRMQSVCARAEAVRRCEVSIASSPGGDRG